MRRIQGNSIAFKFALTQGLWKWLKGYELTLVLAAGPHLPTNNYSNLQSRAPSASLASMGTAHTWCTDIHATKTTNTRNIKISIF